MNQSDILEQPTPPVVVRPRVSDKTRQTKQEIPSEYVRVTFDSLGKLLTPPFLHFKNYNMEVMLQLVSMKEERQLHTLISILNSMVYEDFDCKYLHEKELQTVLMTLYISFWGTTLEDIPYLIDESKPATEENVGRMTVNLSSLKTNPIKPEFKEPISIESPITNKKEYFQLQKQDALIVATDYVMEKYKEQDRLYSDLIALLERRQDTIPQNEKIKKVNKENEAKNALISSDFKIPLVPLKVMEEIPVDEFEAYEEMIKEKSLDIIRVTRACLLHDKSAKTLEDKITLSDKLGLEYWADYECIKRDYEDFGPVNELEVFDPASKKKVLRRLQFQYTDFIPTVESTNKPRGKVSFG